MIRERLQGAWNGMKHNLDWGPVARRRENRAWYQLTQAGLVSRFGECESVLDLGCGKGYVRWVLERSLPELKVYGLDLADWPTRRMQQRSSRTFVRGDGKLLPYRDQAFDGVLMAFVLHHTRYEVQESVIAEALRVARHKVVVLEDLMPDTGDRKVLLRADTRFSPAFGEDKPHDYRTADEWIRVLEAMGGQPVTCYARYATGAVTHGAFELLKT